MSKIPGTSIYECDVCGKTHMRVQNSIYKLTYNKRTRYFCNYSCYNKIVKLKEAKQFEEIDKIFSEHSTQVGGNR